MTAPVIQTEDISDQVGPEASPSEGTAPGTPVPSGKLPFMTLSPKWQLILIGGIFITINIMVMIAFVVALALRN